MPKPTTAEEAIEQLRKGTWVYGSDFEENCRMVLAEITRLRGQETALNAWMRAFGTTQLTHALARLEVAEGKRHI